MQQCRLQVYQFYFHKDRGLNREMMARHKQAGVQAMMLTVDSITGDNRERDKRTGFAIPFRLNVAGVSQFAIRPSWALNYFRGGPCRLPQLENHVDMGRGAMSISHYFTEMLDASLNWDDVAAMMREWDGQFCLKGVMSAADARRAAEIGCTGVVVSNHGGRQLDGSRSSFDQLAEVVDAAGDRLDVLMDGGVQRHACSQSAVAGRESHGGRSLLPFSPGRSGTGRRGACAGADAPRARAGHEADGLHLDRAAPAGEPALPAGCAGLKRRAAWDGSCRLARHRQCLGGITAGTSGIDILHASILRTSGSARPMQDNSTSLALGG
jgi:hypothetical protein